jgi:hypothetical protein
VITVSYTLFAPAGHVEEILEALRIFKGPTERSANVSRAPFLKTRTIRASSPIWKNGNGKGAEDHIRSDHYRQLLFIIEMSARSPRIRFRTATETKGIEFIEALRGGG